VTFSAKLMDITGTWPPDEGLLTVPVNATSSIGLFQSTQVSLLVFVLSLCMKVTLALLCGFTIGYLGAPLRSVLLGQLPPKAKLLFKVLGDGTHGIARESAPPEGSTTAHQEKQVQKYARAITFSGLARWSVPHLLEEMKIAFPSLQRKTVFFIDQMMDFMTIVNSRDEKAAEFRSACKEYMAGGPGCLGSSRIATYPCGVAEAAPYPNPRVSSLRLVAALAAFEWQLPASVSFEAVRWRDFIVLQGKVRASTLMQSLWRMYSTIRKFDSSAEHSRSTKAMCRLLRGSFRRNKLLCKASFFMHPNLYRALLSSKRGFAEIPAADEIKSRLRANYKELGAKGSHAVLLQSAKGGGTFLHSTSEAINANERYASIDETSLPRDASSASSSGAEMPPTPARHATLPILSPARIPGAID
jgi:hypothetical protein